MIPVNEYERIVAQGDMSAAAQYPKCASDSEQRSGRYLGEHYTLCVEALASLGKPEHRKNLLFMWRMVGLNPIRVSADNGAVAALAFWGPKSYRDASATLHVEPHSPTLDVSIPFGGLLSTHRSICEFTELPDISRSLVDWSRGHEPADCPTNRPCRGYDTIGPANANHFGAQAAATYLAYHQKALEFADKHRTRVVACEGIKAKYPDCIQSGRFDGCVSRNCGGASVYRSAALLFEAVGQHYLQDLWSVGHMWNRWGSTRMADYPTERIRGSVALLSGVVHGAEIYTRTADSLSSGTLQAQWGFATDDARYPGVGDLHVPELLTSDILETQRKWLMNCSSLGFSEVNDYLEDPSARADRRRAYPLDKCVGHWATNASMQRAFTLSSPGGTITPAQLAAAASTPGTSVAITLLVNGMGGIATDMPWVSANHFGLAEARVSAMATLAPDGLDAAAARLPKLGAVLGGHHYVASATYALGELNLSFDDSHVAQRGTATRALAMAIEPAACHLYERSNLELITAQCRLTRDPVACALCETLLVQHVFVRGLIPSLCQRETGLAFSERFGYGVDSGACWDDSPPCRFNPNNCEGRVLRIDWASMLPLAERACRHVQTHPEGGCLR